MRRSVPVVATLLFCSGTAVADDDVDLNLCKANDGSGIAACTRLIDTAKQKYARSYYDRAKAYFNKGNSELDLAIADSTKAIELDPTYVNAFIIRGDAYLFSGDDDLAIADYNSAIALDPKKAAAFVNRGSALAGKGEYERAIADYKSAIQIEPNDAAAYALLGNSYRNKGDYASAVGDYDKAIELAPHDTDWMFDRGVAKFMSGDFGVAATDFLHVIELKDDIYAMLFRYVARARSGEMAAAELEANVGRLENKEWPYAVVELYLGKRSPAATLDAAIAPGDRQEAEFYVGQWYIEKNLRVQATTAMKAAVDACSAFANSSECLAAGAELRRLRQ